jgi:deoxyribonuclease V
MVSTYGAVANALGDIRASRSVGRMMNQNPDPDNMPCFRIVYSDGRLGGFGAGITDKIRRLNEDNIKVEHDRIYNFKKVFFNNFITDYPLKKLRKEQLEISKKVELDDDFKNINTIAGFDVAYSKNDFDDCIGACVVMDYKTLDSIEEKTITMKNYFPYIPTYLSFREYPVIHKIFKVLETNPSILMLDGNGILHPYHIGIASYAGVKLSKPSIGVAKNLLIGKLEKNIVKYKNKKIGVGFFSSKKNLKPVYVSPGNKISFDTSLNIVKKVSKYKIPEPIRRAHLLATNSV